jgi:hypothetical protein
VGAPESLHLWLKKSGHSRHGKSILQQPDVQEKKYQQVQNDDKPSSKSMGINLNGGAFCDQNSVTNRTPPNKTTSPTLGNAGNQTNELARIAILNYNLEVF